MNCEDFRRLKLADPHRLSEEARGHERECAACRAFAGRVERADAELERALATPLPRGFAERVLLRGGRRGGASRRLWAVAASLALAVAIGAGYYASVPSPDACARLAIEHVVMGPQSFTSERNANPEALRRVVADFGGTLKGSLGTVRYVRLCPIEHGVTGWHVVLDTPRGPATLLLVADQPLGGEQSASSSGFDALARPAGHGYYAVVTTSAANTAYVDRLVRERIAWKAS